MKRKIDEWQGCYPSKWKGLIVPESMAHPAKYSSRLIHRIYSHMISEGWLERGDSVIDPFGGVALGALDAMRLGLNWYGVELEAKFHDLGNQNIDLWNSTFGKMPNWGSSHLVQGDSRKLMDILNLYADAALSSPPYADGCQHTGGNDPNAEKMQGGKYQVVGLSGAVSSPPYSGSLSTDLLDAEDRVKRARDLGISNAANVSPIDMEKIGMRHQSDYGSTIGQLGAMKADNFEAAISSPPFLQSEGGTPEPKPGGSIDQKLYARHAAGNKSANGYGTSEGQLSSMREGGFDSAVSSPPFKNESKGAGLNVNKPETFRGVLKDGSLSMGESEGNLSAMPDGNFQATVSSPPYSDSDQNYREGWKRFHDGHTPLHANDIQREAEYGNSEGQLSGANDFWLAARMIVEQVYLALQPGGHAVWVVKDYVKNKQVVPFCDQWRRLCEAVGFIALHEHHAMLVHHKGTQYTLEGGTVEHKTESKSFFRRLAEKKGSPRIDFETVFCMVKPE